MALQQALYYQGSERHRADRQDQGFFQHRARSGFGLGHRAERRQNRRAMAGMIAAFAQHAAHIGHAFAALRTVGQLPIHRRHRPAAVIDGAAHLAFGQSMAQADIHSGNSAKNGP